MTCRDAVAADLPSLARVHIAAWRAAYHGLMNPEFLQSLGYEHAARRLRPALEAQPPLVVAVESNREIVGFSRFGASSDANVSPRTGEVFACNVDPQHWRCGFGAELMAATMARLAVMGYESCTLWVLEQNDRARRFYSALGFTPDGAARIEAADTEYPLSEVRYRSSLPRLGFG